MDHQIKDRKTILFDLFQKEVAAGCFDYSIGGTGIYRFVRRSLIVSLLSSSGVEVMKNKDDIDFKFAFKNLFVSLWQVLKMLLSGRHYDTVFIPFMRIDKVRGMYMDKFTDPLIELCFDDNYVIFDQGRAGVHERPRMHKDHCVQTDCLVIGSRYHSKLFWKSFYRKNKSTIDAFCDALVGVYGADCMTKASVAKLVCSGLRYQRYFEILFKKLKSKRVIGPTRRRSEICAAHKLGMKAYECQHGITYGQTIVYGGFQPKETTPDYFLAFGENDPIDVYGIDTDRIVNIGWAFNDYLASCDDFMQYGEKDVLVISDPLITGKIIPVMMQLAKCAPESMFYFRPHPHEKISSEQMELMQSLPNVKLQDNKLNIAMVMRGFVHVIGESSSVLYEALSVGKKVGRLFMGGLSPKYLKEEDRDCFWEIRNDADFLKYLSDQVGEKQVKSIYSPFNKDLFCKITEIK